MRKIAFITGITGFVGSHLADYLLEHTDWEIYGLLRWRSPLDNIAHLLPLINTGKRIHLLYGDLRDSDSINNVVIEASPDYVFHLAAQSFPKTSFTSALDTYETNIQGTHRVLEACRNIHHIKKGMIIHVCSSSEVFGRVTKDKLPIAEDCSFHPASPYAISKVGTDLIARHYAEAYDMCVMVTRMFTHTGPRRGDVFAESSFAKQIAMIEAGLIAPIVKVGNLESARTYADVRDAVRAYFMLVTKNPTPGAYYNIGGEYHCLVGDVLNFLLNISGVPASILEDEDRLRPIDADLQIPDCSKFRAHTGWKPEIAFSTTMTDLLDYWRRRVRETPCLIR
jgi:GDP-mannose 4,6-dehydratase